MVIDGTWEQANKMSKSDSPLLRMKRGNNGNPMNPLDASQNLILTIILVVILVTIAPHETLFWRHQRKDSDHLATIEAMYYFLREYHETYLTALPAPTQTSSTSPSTSTTESASESKVITPHKEWILTHKLGPYTNQFDDMLWFYKYFYELIQKTYRERKDGKEFTLKHTKGYIQYDSEGRQKKEKEKDSAPTETSTIESP